MRRWMLGLVTSLVAACAPAPSGQPYSMSGIGDAARGRRLIAAVGCDACHTIPGVESVSPGLAGPPLSGWSKRSYIAGLLPNTPDQLVQWLRTPQAVKPGDAMPDLGLSARDATDIAAYLYTLQ